MSADDEYKRPTSVATELKRHTRTRTRLDKANKAKVPVTRAEGNEQSEAAKDHAISVGRLHQAEKATSRKTSASKPGLNQK